jgi:hypothetical protein
MHFLTTKPSEVEDHYCFELPLVRGEEKLVPGQAEDSRRHNVRIVKWVCINVTTASRFSSSSSIRPSLIIILVQHRKALVSRPKTPSSSMQCSCSCSYKVVPMLIGLVKQSLLASK